MIERQRQISSYDILINTYVAASADGCAWYENGKMVSSATNYEYQHDGKDKIVQHISSGSTATWTIFTLDSFPEKSVRVIKPSIDVDSRILIIY